MELFLAKSIIRGNVVNGRKINSELVYETLIRKYGTEKADTMMKNINMILITKGYSELVYKFK